jgi:hypothetical protein
MAAYQAYGPLLSQATITVQPMPDRAKDQPDALLWSRRVKVI